MMLSWRLNFPESSQKRRQPFFWNMITPGPIPVSRPWSPLQSLAGLSYHIHCIVQVDKSWTMQATFSWQHIIMAAVASSSADFYKQGMRTLHQCWGKCIASGDDYVGWLHFVAQNLLYPRDLFYNFYLLFQWTWIEGITSAAPSILLGLNKIYWGSYLRLNFTIPIKSLLYIMPKLQWFY
jgi:hypothetical protein